MNVTIEHLRSFKVMAELLNFTKAAEKCYTTQPALSRMMSALEEEWNVVLFERTTRKVTLTPEGEICLKRVRSIIREYDGIHDEITQYRRTLKGELTVGFNAISAPPDWFVAALKMMKEKYPSVNISLNQVPSSKSVYQIQNGELDCAVIYEHSSTLAENLKTRRLTKTCRCAVLSGDSPLAQKETLTLSDIEGEAVIFMKSSELITYRQFCDYRTRLGISTKNDSFVENMSEMALQIELTGGIGITGLYNQYGRDEKIKFIPIKDLNGEENETYLALAWREGDKNPIISTFCDILSQQIENQ